MGNLYKIGNKLVLGSLGTPNQTYAFYLYDDVSVQWIDGVYELQGVVLDDIANNAAVKPPIKFKIATLTSEGEFQLAQGVNDHYYLSLSSGGDRTPQDITSSVLFGKYANYFVDGNDGEVYPGTFLLRKN